MTNFALVKTKIQLISVYNYASVSKHFSFDEHSDEKWDKMYK